MFSHLLIVQVLSYVCFHQAKELDANTDSFLELLAKGIGKPKEEIKEDIRRGKFFDSQEAIDYGIADKIIGSKDAAYEKRVSSICFLPRVIYFLKHDFPSKFSFSQPQ